MDGPQSNVTAFRGKLGLGVDHWRGEEELSVAVFLMGRGRGRFPIEPSVSMMSEG